MAEAESPGIAGASMLKLLDWAYDKVASSIPGLGSAEEMAAHHLERSGGDREKAISSLVGWQVGYAGAAGFVSNLGGLITLPIAVPANLASVILIQMRMIAAIANLRGYDATDPKVRTLTFLCLSGRAGTSIMKEFGVSVSTRLTTTVLTRLSGASLGRINQAVGFSLVAKAGTAGLLNMSRIVPLIGGLVSGSVDAAVTRGIAGVARQMFPYVGREPFDIEGTIVQA
jgi:uncharacterized protein (DUF697 family)